MSDPITGFIDKLAEFGIRLSNPSSLIADGNIHRAHVEGDKHKAKNLCYKIHADSTPAGWFQDHKRGMTESFSLMNGEASKLTPEELAIMRERWAKERAEREAAQAQAYRERALYCRDLAMHTDGGDPATHPYLVRKGLKPSPTMRRIPIIPRAEFFNDPEATGNLQDCLIIPLLDAAGAICSVQAILPDGEKFYAAGASTRAAWHPIKGTRNEPILIVEGWATGAALHAATGCSVLCAMNAGNIETITAFSLSRFPGRRPLIMGDNDHLTKDNPGATKGHAAAEKHGLVCLLPEFTETDPSTDWDDWLRAGGSIDELLASIDRSINPIKASDHPVDVLKHYMPDMDPAKEAEIREYMDEMVPASADVVDIKTKVKRGKGRTTPDGAPPTGAQIDGNTGSVFVSWASLGLLTSHRGEPFPHIDNVLRILTHHPDLTGRLWYDEFHERIFQTIFQPQPADWHDHHDTMLTAWIQSNLKLHKVAVGTVQRAVDSHARQTLRNEPREWMDSLTWDGIERLPTLMADAFGAPMDDYHAAVGRCFMVGMAARTYQPGCKLDNMPVFEGPQGIRKSTALAVLGGKWFAEASRDPSDKDFYLDLTGKLILEIGEMDSFSRVEQTTVKRVISCSTDRYRAPFERRSADHGRRCVFGGTTNKDDWNKDETGARRFWPVACKEVSIDYLRATRDQLFAEAVHRYKAGEPWWDVPQDLAKEQQDLRRDVDDWSETVLNWASGRAEVKVADILLMALDMKIDKHGKSEQMRVASILRSANWKKKVVRRGYQMHKTWINPDLLPL